MADTGIRAKAIEPDGRTVVLPDEQWEHIRAGHPEMARYERAIMETITHRDDPLVTVRISGFEFDYVDYDERADVLYLSIGEPRPPAREEVTSEGHLIRYDEDGSLSGITLVNAKWLIERDGQIALPVRVDLDAQDIAAALA